VSRVSGPAASIGAYIVLAQGPAPARPTCTGDRFVSAVLSLWVSRLAREMVPFRRTPAVCGITYCVDCVAEGSFEG
jgi:hypothetical protein